MDRNMCSPRSQLARRKLPGPSNSSGSRVVFGQETPLHARKILPFGSPRPSPPHALSSFNSSLLINLFLSLILLDFKFSINHYTNLQWLKVSLTTSPTGDTTPSLEHMCLSPPTAPSVPGSKSRLDVEHATLQCLVFRDCAMYANIA